MDLSFFKDEKWMIEAVIAVILLVIVNYILKYLLKYFRRRSLSRLQDWKGKFDYIFYLPIQIMLWVIGLVFILSLVGNRYGFPSSVFYLHAFRNVVLVICSAWILFRWKKEMHRSYVAKQGKKRFDPTILHVFNRLLSITIFVIALLIILQFVGLNIVPLLAFGGIGIAAIGFAAQGMISNFFGGFMLYIARPFTIGDWILVPERQVEGSVEEIGWYLTSIRDREKRPLYLPNSVFSNQIVINSSRMSHRRIEEKIGIDYNDFPKIKEILSGIKKEITAHPRIDRNMPLLVYFTHFSEYTLEITIDVYTLATNYDEFLSVKEDILFRVQKVIEANEAQMPYPTSTIHHK